MASITELIRNIRKAVFGKDVRESIAQAIEQTYEDASKDGNANMEVSEARGTFETLNKRLNNSDNVKADRTELTTESTSRQTADSNLQSQINSLASGSPLVASSVSEMTDTTRVYVNTTDGHWYYYNTSKNEWSIGGTFQSSGISENQIKNYMIDGSERTELGNVVDVDFFTENWLINNANQNGISDNGFNTTNEVEVLPNTSYRVSGSVCFINFYDENRNYIEQQINGTIYVKNVTTPTNAKYVRISGDKTTFQNLMFVNPENFIGTLENPQTPQPCIYTIDTNKLKINANCLLDNSINENKLSLQIIEKLNNISSYFKDKKIGCLGDSITWGYDGATISRAEFPYPTILKNLLNAQDVFNYGISGSTIAGGGSEAEIAGTSPMNIRYDNMDGGVDYVIVMGGTNDHSQSIPLGTINDTSNQTFYGALDVLINGLITKYPSKRICFITPLQKGHYGNNDLGFSFDEYCQAIIEKCKQYSIPVLDLHSMCGCNSKTAIWSTWYQNNLPDNLHPNQNYYYILAKKIANFIESL